MKLYMHKNQYEFFKERLGEEWVKANAVLITPQIREGE